MKRWLAMLLILLTMSAAPALAGDAITQLVVYQGSDYSETMFLMIDHIVWRANITGEAFDPTDPTSVLAAAQIRSAGKPKHKAPKITDDEIKGFRDPRGSELYELAPEATEYGVLYRFAYAGDGDGRKDQDGWVLLSVSGDKVQYNPDLYALATNKILTRMVPASDFDIPDERTPEYHWPSGFSCMLDGVSYSLKFRENGKLRFVSGKIDNNVNMVWMGELYGILLRNGIADWTSFDDANPSAKEHEQAHAELQAFFKELYKTAK